MEKPVYETNVVTGAALLAMSENVRGWRKRDCYQQLSTYLYGSGHDSVCLLFGMRRTGKTTLLRQIAESLLGRSDIRAAYMPQNYAELLPPDVTPVEFLTKSGRHDEISRVRTFLGSVKYTPEEMEHPAA